jgi:MFS family permease
MLRVLRNRPVRALLVAEVVSMTGSQMSGLALPWFVLATTGSATKMGLVVTAELVSVALFGIPGGAVAGRIGPRRSLVLTNACAGPVILSVPLLYWAGLLSFPLLLAITFVFGIFWAPYFAAQRAALPELLGEDEALVGEANAFLQAAQRVTMLLGPVLAGALIGVVGAPAVLVVDAGTFVFALFAILAFVPKPEHPVEIDEDARGMLAGLRYVAKDPFLRSWAVIMAVGDAAWQALFAALPFYAFTRYHHDAKLAGILIACFGVSAVAGNALSFRIRPHVDPLRLIALGVMCQALPLWLLVGAGPAWMVAAALLLSGLANGVVNPSLHAMLTMRLPVALRTQGLAAILVADITLAPVGYLGAGLALGHYGVTPVFVAVPLVQTLAMGARAITSIRERGRLQVAPVDS